MAIKGLLIFTLDTNPHWLIAAEQISSLNAPESVQSNRADLDQNGSNDVIGATHVVEIVIFGITETEARELNSRIDGARANSASEQGDFSGRLIYGKPGPNGRTDVLIHVAHK